MEDGGAMLLCCCSSWGRYVKIGLLDATNARAGDLRTPETSGVFK